MAKSGAAAGGASTGSSVAALVANLQGALVRVALADRTRLEGVVSRPDGACLVLRAVRVFPPSGGAPCVADERRVPLGDLSFLETVEPVDLALGEAAGATPGGFATDAEIGAGSSSGNGRELLRWSEPDACASPTGVALDLGAAHGSWDQFGANERLFGVRTTFDELEYTTAIDRSTPEYRAREASAARIARDIERGGSAGNVHVAEERGHVFDDSQIDEEDRYGAVVRPPPGLSGPASAPPASAVRPSESTEPARSSESTRTPSVSYRQAALSVHASREPSAAPSPPGSPVRAPRDGPSATERPAAPSTAQLKAPSTAPCAAPQSAPSTAPQSAPCAAPQSAPVKAQPAAPCETPKPALNPNAAAFVPSAEPFVPAEEYSAYYAPSGYYVPAADYYAPYYGGAYAQGYGGAYAPGYGGASTRNGGAPSGQYRPPAARQ